VIAADMSSLVLSPPLSTEVTTDLIMALSSPSMQNDDTPSTSIDQPSSHIDDVTPVNDADAPDAQEVREITENIVCFLSRLALYMLWHQRLGHLNFRRLSTMLRFVKGMPYFTLSNKLEACPVCLAAKMRKQPAGMATTMRSVVYNQGILIDFGFMVQRSKNTKRQHNLVSINVLRFDHSSLQWAIKWTSICLKSNWLANNTPDCLGKYVCMDGGGELGRSRDVHSTFMNFGYSMELTGPDSSHQNGPGERPHQTIGNALCLILSGANVRGSFWSYAFYHYGRL
jgi:hypothetical protein